MWSLGISLGPRGIGSAVRVENSHLIGEFPTIARALSAAAAGAPDTPPERTLVVHPQTQSPDRLGISLGDLASAGVSDYELVTDVRVLSLVDGGPVILIDADSSTISTSQTSEGFDADRLAELVAADPFATTVYLTGAPAVRDRLHLAARDFAPRLVERPALAALALTVVPPVGLARQPGWFGRLRRWPRDRRGRRGG